MGHVASSQEINRSLEVFSDPSAYAPFSLTKDYMRIVGCIDPRDQKIDDLKVVVQTAGGAVGKGYDSALSMTAVKGHPHTLKSGMSYDALLQRSTVADAHGDICKFLYGLEPVTREIIEPTDFTRYTLGSLITRYEYEHDSFGQNVRRVQRAAEENMVAFENTSAEDILEAVNDTYPNHKNVLSMNGENRAGFYILNHHPYVGLDRNRIHRGENPLEVQAYHDSVRAAHDSLLGTVGMPTEMKGLRLAALFLRVAATKTVLTGGDDRMIHLNVVPTPHGPQIEREF